MEKCANKTTKQTKFILSLVSAILFQLGSSVVLASGNLGVYFLSYLHYIDGKVNMQYGNIMSPIMVLLISAFSPLSGIISKKLGPRITFLISNIIVEICLVGFYFQKNLWLFYTLCLFSGVGTGLSAGVPLQNACRYYPKKKGLIGSIVLSIGGLGSALFVYLGEKIVNPDNRTIIDKKTEPYYPPEVANDAKKYFIFAMCVVPFTTVMSILLFYPYSPSCEEDINNMKIGSEENNEKNTNTTEILCNFRFWKNMIIIGLMPFWVNFLACTYRAYSPMLGVDKDFIPFLSPLMTLLASLFGPLFAFLIDKFGYQIITKVITAICTIDAFYFIFVLKEKIPYLIGLYVSSCAQRTSLMSIINPHIMQIYGMKNFLIIGGFSRLLIQLAAFIAAMISIIISINHKNVDQLHTPYTIIAIIGTVLGAIGFIFTFFENDESFFEKKDQNNNQNNNNKETDMEYKLKTEEESAEKRENHE